MYKVRFSSNVRLYNEIRNDIKVRGLKIFRQEPSFMSKSLIVFGWPTIKDRNCTEGIKLLRNVTNIIK